jgi:alcohol dehydrogenase class IV/acyl-CoA reductase-like NAD-dependent aldehyde dehydrogenase
MPHLPILRLGRAYESLDVSSVVHHATGDALADVSQANGGLIRRDLQHHLADSRAALDAFSHEELLRITERAGELFLNADLPAGTEGTQSPEDYLAAIAGTSGMPHTLGAANMKKVYFALTHIRDILRGLSRGLDLSVIDTGMARQNGALFSYYPNGRGFGVVLPNNSPGVNSLWLPSIPLKTPVVLKPGREEPFTPWRIIQAFIAAGCPAEAFGFYPTGHEGANTILTLCGRGMMFGDARSTARYASDRSISIHGPGYSKILIGEDLVDDWPKLLDVLTDSVAANGGRSCINASAIITPRHGREIAQALAEAIADIPARPMDAGDARLCAFANSHIAEIIDASIDQNLESEGAIDLAREVRGTPRLVEVGGSTFLLPTVIYADSPEHPIFNKEYMFPFVVVTEMPQAEMLDRIGPTLVGSVITHDPDFEAAALRSSHIDRLNIGPLPTSKVEWDQPHEGNLFEFLYSRRAIQVKGNGAFPIASAEPAAPIGFDFEPRRTRLVYGPGSLNQLGELAKSIGGSHVLLVTDPGIVAAGHATRAQELLRAAGLAVTTYDQVHENPTTDDVDACLAVARGADVDCIVGLGGGSSMDTAKGCNFLLTNGGVMADYWGVGKAKQEMLPLIAVPTTAGTGSECQSFALIANAETHQKMACGDPKAAARIAILDPSLTLSQPPLVAACTGMDALVHAIETAVTSRRNAESLLYAHAACKLVLANFETALREPDNLAAHSAMLLGAAYSGMAIERSMLGAAHAMANPLTAHADIIHGRAVGLMLPGVIRFNAADSATAEQYRELAVQAGVADVRDNVATAVDKLVARVEALLRTAQLAARLSELGISEDLIPTLAEEAASQWTGTFNPRPITVADFAALYRAAL